MASIQKRDILNYHGEFHYVFSIFVSEEEYREWFEANK